MVLTDKVTEQQFVEIFNDVFSMSARQLNSLRLLYLIFQSNKVVVTNPKTFFDLYHVFRCGFKLGGTSHNDVVTWAIDPDRDMTKIQQLNDFVGSYDIVQEKLETVFNRFMLLDQMVAV